MKQSLRKLLWHELSMLAFDKWIVLTMFAIPLAFAVMVGSTFRAQVLQDLPVAVVDMDNTRLSRKLIRDLDAHKVISVRSSYRSTHEAVNAMRTSEVYAVVEIPYDFAQKVIRGESPQVSAFYNTQFVMIGRNMNKALNQVVRSANARVGTLRKLSGGNTVLEQAAGHSIPLQRQGVALYNMSANYGQFLVTVILPCAWQILIFAITILSLVAVDRAVGLETWFKQYGVAGLFFKLTFYQILLLGTGLGLLIYFYMMKHWHMNGSIAIVMFTQYLTVITCQAMGWVIYFKMRDAARALSTCTVFSATSFAFVGVTFPASDMNMFAAAWRALHPVTHYMRVQIMQASYDAPVSMVLQHWWPLLLIATVFSLILHRQLTNLSHPSNAGDKA